VQQQQCLLRPTALTLSDGTRGTSWGRSITVCRSRPSLGGDKAADGADCGVVKDEGGWKGHGKA